ncbi:MAG: hypothetical protein DIU72_009965 [Pseudomonadota bacterium]|nr:MAG: hypothetical protein DIU72_11200 [Pseudomonadota bacterium]
MLVAALVLFLIAAVGGVVMAAVRIRNEKNPPVPIAIVHGLAGATGLILLLIYVFGSGFPGLPTVSAVLFVIAAIGGFVLVSNHAKGNLIPKPLVVVHALIAVTAFVLLFIAAVA